MIHPAPAEPAPDRPPRTGRSRLACRAHVHRPAQRWAGRQDAGQDPALRGELLDVLVRRAEKALAGIRRSTRPSDAPRREELEQVYTGLIEMKKEWDAWQR